MSTAPKLLEIDYSCLKTELSLSLPGSQQHSDDQVLELSLFDQQTHPNANASYSFNINTRDSVGKGMFVLPDSSSDMKWGLSVNSGSQSHLVIEKGPSLFSHGSGTCNGVNVLEINGGICKKDMDIDVVASDSDKPPMAKKPATTDPAAKAQVIGWPPIRSFRKNSVAAASTKNSHEADGKSDVSCLYVKVSMDGAPYLRKVDLKLYKNYKELSLALKKMFSSFTVGKDVLGDCQLNDMHQGSECVLTYKDKDGDWMLVGDVPWDMFTSTCKRLRIMKGSEGIVKGRGQ